MGFFEGFEKRALETRSLVGKAEGLLSGLRSYDKGGVVRNPGAMKPGHSVIPRAAPQQVATFAEHHTKHNWRPNLPWKPEM